MPYQHPWNYQNAYALLSKQIIFHGMKRLPRSKNFSTGWIKMMRSFSHFYLHGGIIKVLDFLTATMNDVNCTGNVRFNCIGLAAGGIRYVAETGFGDNKDIILKILASAVDYGGLDILINASEEYIGRNNTYELYAASGVWCAFFNIYLLRSETEIIKKEKANAVFETGIDVLSHLKLVLIDEGSSIVVGNIFHTLAVIVGNKYVTKDFIQNNNCISKCLDVFKKQDGTWKDNKEFEKPTVRAFSFIAECHYQELLIRDFDYELILPFCAFAFKIFGTKELIRDSGIKLVGKSFAFVRDKNIIKRSGCMGALGSLLGSNEIVENEKQKIGALIGKIAELP